MPAAPTLHVADPSGREWTVRVVRFRLPPWRPAAHGDLDDAEEGALLSLLFLLVSLVWALVAVTVVPLLVFVVELPYAALRAVFSSHRLVVATHTRPAGSRMTWSTDAEHAQAVADQVASQLRLGSGRVDPHLARFHGFSRPPLGGEG